MSHPPVTMALKAYRQEAVVAEAVAALFAQEGPPIEILLSDDASPDGTFEILRAMAEAYDGPHSVRLNRNPRNLGIVGHVNRIAELASGRLIIDCSGDDVSEPDRARTLSRAWAAGQNRPGRRDVMAVYSGAVTMDIDGRLTGHAWQPPPAVLEAGPRGPDLDVILRLDHHLSGAASGWDKRLWETWGPLPVGRLPFQDHILSARAALLGEIAYVDRPLLRHRLGGVSGRVMDAGAGRVTFRSRWLDRLGYELRRTQDMLGEVRRSDAPQAQAAARRLEAWIAEEGWEYDHARLPLHRRWAALPGLAARSLAARDPRWLRKGLKHALRLQAHR